MGLSPRELAPPLWGLVDKGNPTEEEVAAGGITRTGLYQDHPAAPISPFQVGKLEEKRENMHPENCP